MRDLNTQETGCIVNIAKSVNEIELILVEFDPKKDPKVYTKKNCHEKIVIVAVTSNFSEVVGLIPPHLISVLLPFFLMGFSKF